MAITETDKKMFKTYFNTFLELMDRREEVNEEVKLLTGDVAQLLNSKKPIATRVLKELKKRHDQGESDLDEIFELIELLS